MVGLQEFRGMNLVSWFPGVITFRVSLPFDEVLEHSGSPMILVVGNTFHFIFFFSIDKIRWWPGEVGAVHSRLLIG